MYFLNFASHLFSNVEIKRLGLVSVIIFCPENKHTSRRTQVHLSDDACVSIPWWWPISEPITWLPSWPHFTSTHTVYTKKHTPSLILLSTHILNVKLWIFRKSTRRVYDISVSAKTKDLTHPVRWHWLRCSELPHIMWCERQQ